MKEWNWLNVKVYEVKGLISDMSGLDWAVVGGVVVIAAIVLLKLFKSPKELSAELMSKSGAKMVEQEEDHDDGDGPYDPDEMFLPNYKGPYPKCTCGAEIKKVLIYKNKDSDDCYEDQYRIMACPACYQVLPVILAE